MDCLTIVLQWLQRFSVWFALLYVVFLLLVLLYPYNFADPLVDNGVSITAGEAMSFPSKSMLRSEESLAEFYQAMVSGRGLSVAFVAKSYASNQRGPARIISYSKNPWGRNFTLGQYGSALSIRLRTPTSGYNGTRPEVFVPGVFIRHQYHHIVISYDFKTLKVYVDGVLRRHRPGPSGDFSNWGTNFALVFGNELTAGQPWLGELKRVTIYNRPLTALEVQQGYNNYLRGLSPPIFTMAAVADFKVLEKVSAGKEITNSVSHIPIRLFAPERLGSEKVNFLRGPYETLRSHLFYAPQSVIFDIVANIVLFIPLGVLLFLFLRSNYSIRQSLLWATLFGCLLTLGAESLQYFLASRHSSILDVIDNTIGVIVGCLSASYLLSKYLVPARKLPCSIGADCKTTLHGPLF